jgi:hypothetical protein
MKKGEPDRDERHNHMKRLAVAFLVVSSFASSGCRRSIEPPLVQLFDSTHPILTIGGDVDDPNARVYKLIDQFTVDRSGNVYIANDVEFTIDKFDPQGRFLSAVGRKGQGPGEFDGRRRIPSFGVDSQGLIYTSSLQSKIVVHNPDGSLNREFEFPVEAKGYYVGLIKIAPNDDIHVMFYKPGDEVVLARFSPGFKTSQIYHRAPARKNTALGGFLRFLPDLDFDRSGNVYVTDGFEYRLLVYSPAGELIRTLNKPFLKNKIAITDLALYSGKGQELIDYSIDPNAVRIIDGLSKAEGYLPSIFGVKVLVDGLILWTSNRDSDFKYLFDIYDKEFRLIGRSSEYNWVCQNSARVRENRIYLLELGSDDMEFKKKIGRLSPFDYPFRVHVYEIKTLITS